MKEAASLTKLKERGRRKKNKQIKEKADIQFFENIPVKLNLDETGWEVQWCMHIKSFLLYTRLALNMANSIQQNIFDVRTQSNHTTEISMFFVFL